MASECYDVVVVDYHWNGRGGWRCECVVLDADSPDEFDVEREPKFVITIGEAEMTYYVPTYPHLLAEACLRFLLDREPRESIHPEFGTADIRRSFPEFDSVIKTYLL
jgi:hypothetical protein